MAEDTKITVEPGPAVEKMAEAAKQLALPDQLQQAIKEAQRKSWRYRIVGGRMSEKWYCTGHNHYHEDMKWAFWAVPFMKKGQVTVPLYCFKMMADLYGDITFAEYKIQKAASETIDVTPEKTEQPEVVAHSEGDVEVGRPQSGEAGGQESGGESPVLPVPAPTDPA